MANIEDCPGFETFGSDVKAARQAKSISRKAMAEKVNIDWRYLANIENEGAIPSLPVIIQLIKACGLPVERYFNPEIIHGAGRNRHRASGYRACLCNRCNTARPVPRPRRHRRGPPRSLQGAKAPYIWPASFCNTSRQSCSHGFQRLSPVPLDGAAGHSHHRADLAVRQFQDTMQYQDALSRLGQAGKGSGHQPVADLKLTAIGRKYKTVAGVLIYRA